MTTTLATLNAAEVAQARTYASAAKADNTRRAYASDWAAWQAWSDAHQTPACPCDADMLAVYLSSMAEDHKPSSIARALAAITAAHYAAGATSPRGNTAVVAVMQGIRRMLGTAQKQARAVTPEQLREAVKTASPRDRALLLLGFAGGFRRSELVALDVGDLALSEDGLTVTLRRSKTDQEGQGRKVGIPYAGRCCPVRAVVGYLGERKAGPVFLNERGGRLTGKSVACIVKALLGPEFSPHGLRSGLVTAATKAGKSTHAIMKTTGHRSVAMVERYRRDASVFEDTASEGIL